MKKGPLGRVGAYDSVQLVPDIRGSLKIATLAIQRPRGRTLLRREELVRQWVTHYPANLRPHSLVCA